MIAGLKPYAEYTDSGLPWLGQVPAHWQIVRSKRLFTARKDLALPDDPQLSATQAYGVIEQAEFERRSGHRVVKISMHLDKRKHVEKDDFVISMRSFQGGIERAWASGAIRSSYVVLKPGPGVHASFFQYVLKSAGYIRALQATGDFIRDGQDLSFANFVRVDLPLVPMDEQAAVARFLDWANGRLERTIQAKRKVIALLTEQKQAIVQRAVTFGLEPNVPRKSSGISWIGDIPSHWEVRRVKQATRILRGKFSHRPRNDPSLYDGLHPFIQTGEVAQAAKFITNYRQSLNDKGLAVSKVFPSGTLVMTIAANIGEVAILTFDACFPDSIVGFVPRHGIDRDYLYLMFLAMKPELLREAPVNTQGNLNVERVGAMKISLPSIDEQKQIVRCVEIEVASFAAGIDRIQREIELLREYRTRFVADVVTGKLDVRKAAAQLSRDPQPDYEADSPEPTDEELEA